MHELKNRPTPKMLFAIVNKDKSEDIAELVKDCNIYLQYRTRGVGTARSETLDLLGLDRTDKNITICVGPSHSIDDLLKELSAGLRLKRRGNGIAFTLPISGVSSRLFKLMDEELRKNIHMYLEREAEKVKTETNYELILAIINRGYSEELMDAAREAGATGGTVVHARHMYNQEVKAWGISVQEEKEIIYILAKKENKLDIMKAIGKRCGMSSDAQGFVISLPVDGIEGVHDM